ncbi:hypothetical protein AKJ39_00945 [candidate division MSBL1 archaeon SCGC-AAA259J03]|uniref:Glutaredoxin domain-containing protein n=1 Tax=candidate division MSBL1 archaeon SCGC-AAA259J03 TaxID=1698269 RepID=A0A656YX43_9EURY|nr:hypothetical protein AKJ39_00945 [candidate division MSBL1 archaeon SCGC-AAA259J03]
MRRILDELNVNYEELDIDKEPKYREELDEKMGNADRVPVLEKNGEVIHIGYGSKEDIEKKLD